MAMVTSGHVRLDARGVAWIDDTNVKVIEVVLDRMANGWSEISQQSDHVRRIREQAGESPLAIRLEARGLLR
jgi:hypothetical protein